MKNPKLVSPHDVRDFSSVVLLLDVDVEQCLCVYAGENSHAGVPRDS